MSKTYKVSDLHIGMKVTTHELSEIYDTYILLSQIYLNDDGSTTGTIEFIAQEQSQEMAKVFNECLEKYGKRPMIFRHAYLPDGIYSVRYDSK